MSGAVLEDLATSRRVEVRAKVVVDATDLGDVVAGAGAAFDVGLEADSASGETAGIAASSDVVQDLTWCATLKDYGPGANRTIPRPEGYDPAEFDCSSTSYCKDATREKPTVDARKMLDYARLPGGKYLVNWPNYGNDTYLNVVGLDDVARERALEAAKARTLRFVYFIQAELGFRNLGLADDEYPTTDKLPLVPYHREGRRLRGVVRFTARDIAEPFGSRDPLYRTGVSVGDYPIDHHHKRNAEAPQHLSFVPVPSFSVPLGALIPEAVDGLVVADKAISVSNVANGTTRLQPVVLLTGQAAGALAALAVRQGREPRAVPVRDVQRALLEARAFLLPYLDVPPDHPQFARIQRVGATGILKGKGVPHQWANQTWFYPDFPIDAATLAKGLAEFEKVEGPPADGRPLTVGEALTMLTDYRAALLKKDEARFAALEGKAATLRSRSSGRRSTSAPGNPSAASRAPRSRPSSTRSSTRSPSRRSTTGGGSRSEAGGGTAPLGGVLRLPHAADGTGGERDRRPLDRCRRPDRGAGLRPDTRRGRAKGQGGRSRSPRRPAWPTANHRSPVARRAGR